MNTVCGNCGQVVNDLMREAGMCINCGALANEFISEEEYRRRYLEIENIEKKKEREKRENEERKEREKLENEIRIKKNNDKYEYVVETMYDDSTGYVNIQRLSDLMNFYANNGWRLKSIISNEVGKNVTSVGIGGISSGNNATIDQIILVFERLIMRAED